MMRHVLRLLLVLPALLSGCLSQQLGEQGSRSQAHQTAAGPHLPPLLQRPIPAHKTANPHGENITGGFISGSGIELDDLLRDSHKKH
ncbi:MAG: hypothetical protein Q4F40_06330 [Akkermansia sp.]|nr:hypothetical protein [Akkermansia sp.]